MASIHMPHLPCWNSARFSLKPFDEAPCGAGVLHQVDVELQRVLPFRLVELRLPVLVEPARAEGVGHGGQEGHVLAPAGLAAQADAVDVGGAVGDLAAASPMNSQVGASGMCQPGLLEQVLAVHDEGRLAVERRGVELAVDRQAAGDRRDDVGGVVVGAEIVERQQPAAASPRSEPRRCRSSSRRTGRPWWRCRW